MTQEEQHVNIIEMPDLPDPFPLLSSEHFDTVYYWDERRDANFLFMFHKEGIIKYNMDDNTVEGKYESPVDISWYEEVEEIRHIICLNPINKRLYFVLDGHNVWISFNIETETWNTDAINGREFRHQVNNLFFIPSPINQVHAIGWLRKVYWQDDGEDQQFRVLEGSEPLQSLQSDVTGKFGKLAVSFTYQNKLMVLQKKGWRQVGDIFSCEFKGPQQNQCEWKPADILPNGYQLSPDVSKAFVAWDQILFFIGLGHQIDCIDLLHMTAYKDIKYKEQNQYPCLQYAFKTNDNYLHMFRYCKRDIYYILGAQATDEEEQELHRPIHIQIRLSELVPDEIIENNRPRLETLVAAYCKEVQNTEKIQVPVVLRELIFDFCPVFL